MKKIIGLASVILLGAIGSANIKSANSQDAFNRLPDRYGGESTLFPYNGTDPERGREMQRQSMEIFMGQMNEQAYFERYGRPMPMPKPRAHPMPNVGPRYCPPQNPNKHVPQYHPRNEPPRIYYQPPRVYVQPPRIHIDMPRVHIDPPRIRFDIDIRIVPDNQRNYQYRR